MTTETLSAQQRAAVRLSERQGEPANLWLDAWRRLIRNRMAMVGGLIVLLLITVALFAPQVAPYHYAEGDSVEERTVPSWLAAILPGDIAAYAKISNKFLLGSDFLGRDILSRLIYGTRVSLPVGFLGATTALLIGIVIGCISGYYGGRVDTFLMGVVDIMYAFPTTLLIILMMAFFKSTFASVEPGTVAYAFNQVNDVVDRILGLRGGGMLFIFLGIGVTAWMGMARLTRGQILSVKEKEFIEAAHMIGAGDIRIIIRHVLPNILGPCIVAQTLAIPVYINYEVFLSFIGLGVDPPTPSWGAMISDGARAIRSFPHLVLFPALALALTMFAFNFLGDGLRDALDPKMKGTS
ncbi:MAG TPA: ABC transporter permease [Anaerolineae bacterium]|nr:ABC transporter permease [Anaerolineae bacterium]